MHSSLIDGFLVQQQSNWSKPKTPPISDDNLKQKRMKMEKILSNLHMPSPIKKEKRLKELQLSDLMTALINQEKHPDRTQDLKEYLFKRKPLADNEDDQFGESAGDDLVILPEWAVTEYNNQEELLMWHIHMLAFMGKKKESNRLNQMSESPVLKKEEEKEKSKQQRKASSQWHTAPLVIDNRIWQTIANYQHLQLAIENILHKKLTLLNNSQAFIQTTLLLEDISEKLTQTHEKLSVSKAKIKHLLNLYNKRYKVLMVLNRKRDNMDRILQGVRVWEKYGVAGLLRVDLDKIDQSPDRDLILDLEQCIQRLKEMVDIDVDGKPQQMVRQKNERQIEIPHKNSQKSTKPTHQSQDKTEKNKINSVRNIIKVLQEKRRHFQQKISQKHVNSILDYVCDEKYIFWYELYRKLSHHHHQSNNNRLSQQQGSSIDITSKINDSLNKLDYYSKMIDKNIGTILGRTLQLFTHSTNPQILNESQYLSFLQELVNQFMAYIQKWHRVTTAHLNTSLNRYEESQFFMKNRGVVFCKMAEKLAAIIKYSTKMLSFGFQNKIRMVEMMGKFIEKGEEWMGKNKTCLGEVLREKMRIESEAGFKSINAELKAALGDQLSGEVKKNGMSQHNSKKSSGWGEEQLLRLTAFLEEVEEGKDRESIQRVKAILSISPTSKPSSSYLISNNNGNSLIHEKLKQQPTISLEEVQKSILRLSSSSSSALATSLFSHLVRTLIDYLLKEPYSSPHNCQLSKFEEHIEYLIVILYKTLIPEETRLQIQEQLWNGEGWRERMKMLQSYSSANNSNSSSSKNQEVNQQQQSTLISELIQQFKMKRDYAELYEYLSIVLKKYSDVSISQLGSGGVLPLGKYYTQFQKYEVIIKSVQGKAVKTVEHVMEALQVASKVYRLYASTLIRRNSGERNAPVEHGKTQRQQRQLEDGYKVQRIVQICEERLSNRIKNVLVQLLRLNAVCYSTNIHRFISKQIAPLMGSLKWEIRKFTKDTNLEYKEYKNRLLQIYKNCLLFDNGQAQSSSNVGGQPSEEIRSMVSRIQSDRVYYFLVDLYSSRIQKINDNGRQMLRLEYIELMKQIGGNSDILQKYLEISNERSGKTLLEKIEREQMWLSYPLGCLRVHLMWVYSDCSSKERKQFVSKLMGVYRAGVKGLPEI